MTRSAQPLVGRALLLSRPNATIGGMGNYLRAIGADELQPGERAVVELDGLFVAVFRVGDQYFAIEDVCTHDEGPLGDGELDGFEVECPRHGGRFDIRTGQAVRFPAVSPVRRFEVKVEGDEVWVDAG